MTVYGFDAFLNCVNGIDGIPLTRGPGEYAIIKNGKADMHSQRELSSTFAQTQAPPRGLADTGQAVDPVARAPEKPSFS
jgi:hypothetical protein